MPRRPHRLVPLAALALLVAGCGDDATGSPSGATDPDVVETATSLVEAGESGLVGFDGPEADITLESIHDFDEWNGPETSPPPVEGAHLEVIVCSVGTSCEEVGNAVKSVAEELGWTADVRDGQGSPEGFQQAMATAAATGPDAVVTVAIPENQVADGIAELDDQGVPVVGISAIDEGGSVGYDAYVSGRETFLAAMEAVWVIADSGGTGKAVFLWLDGYPHLVEALDAAQRVMAECDGCEVLEVRNRTLTQALDPVEMAEITTSLVQQYGGDLEYLVLPGGVGASYAIEALHAAGRDDVAVVAKNAEPERLGSVAAGDQAADFGAIRGWNAYAAVDQVNRLLNGEEPIPDSEHGIPARVFVPDNAPADGVVDWSQLVDFADQYRALWGLGDAG